MARADNGSSGCFIKALAGSDDQTLWLIETSSALKIGLAYLHCR